MTDTEKAMKYILGNTECLQVLKSKRTLTSKILILADRLHEAKIGVHNYKVEWGKILNNALESQKHYELRTSVSNDKE